MNVRKNWDWFKYCFTLSIVLISWFSSSATVSMGGRSGATIVNHLADGFESVANYEVIVKPAIKGFGQNTLAQSIRQGMNFADDAGQGFSSMNRFKTVYGKAGQGQAWHHIVEQHDDNIGKFGAESIHNTNNLIKLPEGAGSIHRKITGFYNSIQPEITGSNSLKVRNWIKTQSFDEQYKFGLEAIKRFTPR
jgi:hypothetical protein